jgi:hypothetical protein
VIPAARWFAEAIATDPGFSAWLGAAREAPVSA